MAIQLSEHFTTRKLLYFTLPSIVMMIFTSVYSVVDGFFVSNFVGKTAFAAVNFIMPYLLILGALGFMFGTSGSALIAKSMGEGQAEKANAQFSLFVYVALIGGVLVTVLGFLGLRPIAALLGAEGAMLEDCVRYGRIILIALPAYMLQYAFQAFFVAAEKPQLGLGVTVVAGLTNIVLDALLVAVIPLGLVGAALATALSQAVGGLLPLLYFAMPNTSCLRLGKTRWNGRWLGQVCLNGSSELMSNISMPLVGMLYNMQLMRVAGEDGVAAYGVIMYVNMIFLALFIGYSVGSAPLVSYHYGAENHEEMRNLRRKSLMIIGCFAVLMFVAAELLAVPLATLFVGYDAALCDMTVHGFRVFSISFLFAGFAVYGSGFFTALNNGPLSALISFLRTLVFETAAIIILPFLFGIDGIWISVVVAEFIATVIAFALMYWKRKVYQY